VIVKEPPHLKRVATLPCDMLTRKLCYRKDDRAMHPI